jgi:hypothetical protein
MGGRPDGRCLDGLPLLPGQGSLSRKP